AIAAALADLGVDEDALVGIGKLAALAAAPLLRSAGLIVDESRDALRLGQRPLHGHQLAAMMRRNAIGQTVGALVLIRLVRDHLDAADALCQKLLRNLRDADSSVELLPARHGDGVVVENFESDVRTGRHGRSDGKAAGVQIRAVAEILKDVLALRERRLADPVGALAAHL